MSAREMPVVSGADIVADWQWFADHPRRRYRRRPGSDGADWVVRRRGTAIYLRTLARTAIPYPDTDEALRQLWFLAAWPELDPRQREALIREARKAERSAPGGRQGSATGGGGSTIFSRSLPGGTT